MNAKWNDDLNIICIKEKLSNGQTLEMSAEMIDYNIDTNYWNIGLCVYNKRKSKDHNEDNKLITGTVPFETAMLAMKAFPIIEAEILTLFSGYNNIIMCHGTEGRRNRAYYKYLSKRGYEYGNFDGYKYIMKTFKKED